MVVVLTASPPMICTAHQLTMYRMPFYSYYIPSYRLLLQPDNVHNSTVVCSYSAEQYSKISQNDNRRTRPQAVNTPTGWKKWKTLGKHFHANLAQYFSQL